MHVIAAKAVALKEAGSKEFKEYQSQIVKNSTRLAGRLEELRFRIVSGGTDNHLSLIDLQSKGISGRDAALILDKIRITVNKNLIPFDKRSAAITSGLRLGTPAVTTRGMKEHEMNEIADIINLALTEKEDSAALKRCIARVDELTRRFSLYPELL